MFDKPGSSVITLSPVAQRMNKIDVTNKRLPFAMKTSETSKDVKDNFQTPTQKPNPSYFKTGMSSIMRNSNSNLPKIVP